MDAALCAFFVSVVVCMLVFGIRAAFKALSIPHPTVEEGPEVHAAQAAAHA